MFFYTASGVLQSINQFFRFKWIRGSFLLATYRFLWTKLWPILASVMAFMLTLPDNTVCIAAIEVLSWKAYNCSPSEFPRSAIMPDLCLISFTGCPKSSFLYFISLYFRTIGLGKHISLAKVVSFSLIHYFHTCCAIFWLEYSICVLPR